MKSQSCPNCQRVHDVAVYVSGQRVMCSCGIRFDVRRTDVSGIRTPLQRPERGQEEVEVAGTVVPSAANVLLERTFISSPRLELPGFELLELLGRGGMGEVWRAHQKSLGRVVAVKLLPPDLARDPEFVRRFDKEATALASLSHPNVTQIIDRGVSGDHYFIAMEFVEGRSLREVLNAGRPQAQDALKLMAQILRAVEYAHEKRVIHRDLKPENILLDSRGHVKVADFGLAGMRGGEERLQMTATAVAMGTLNYMAPEQRKDARNVDARADLYSLGVILYELLTGDLPIGHFRMPSEKVPGLDARLDGVVASLLKTDPLERCGSATEALGAIEGLLTHSGVGLLPGQYGRGTPAPKAETFPPRVVAAGRKALKTGLLVVGALATVGILARVLFPGTALTISGSGKEFTLTPAGIQTTEEPKGYPPNTYGEVFSEVVDEDLPGGRTRLELGFGVGEEELNVHTGQWRLIDGRLEAIQAGNETGDERLIPRAYVAHRYFSTDDYTASVNVTLKEVKDRYEVEENASRFGELAIRIKNLQVSAFAIPGGRMQLAWRYRQPDGDEISGSSAQDLEMLVEDEAPTPADGKAFRLGLRLRRAKAGIEAEGLVNGRTFARKVLPGLERQVGKIALGCRNYECDFDDLVVEGREEERPQLRSD